MAELVVLCVFSFLCSGVAATGFCASTAFPGEGLGAHTCLCVRCVAVLTVFQVQDREYKKLWGRVNSKEHLELLDEDQEVVVPKKDPTNKSDTGEDGGLYPIDVLDPSLYVPLHVVYYYHNLIWYLKKHNYEPAKTLFGFGFDFRQSNMKHLDELIARLEAASAANNGVKCAPQPLHLLRPGIYAVAARAADESYLHAIAVPKKRSEVISEKFPQCE